MDDAQGGAGRAVGAEGEGMLAVPPLNAHERERLRGMKVRDARTARAEDSLSISVFARCANGAGPEASACMDCIHMCMPADSDPCAHVQVCVTGGGGYIASHIVARLLAAGSTVHATVR